MEVFQCMCISIYVCIYMCIYVRIHKHIQNKKKYCWPYWLFPPPTCLPIKKICYDSLYFTIYYKKNIFTCRNTGVIFLLCPWNSYYIFWIWLSFTYISTWVGRHPILPFPLASISMPTYRLLHIKKCSKRRHLQWLFSYAEYKRSAFLFLGTPQKL